LTLARQFKLSPSHCGDGLRAILGDKGVPSKVEKRAQGEHGILLNEQENSRFRPEFRPFCRMSAMLDATQRKRKAAIRAAL
jgi:hypothetical protein